MLVISSNGAWPKCMSYGVLPKKWIKKMAFWCINYQDREVHIAFGPTSFQKENKLECLIKKTLVLWKNEPAPRRLSSLLLSTLETSNVWWIALMLCRCWILSTRVDHRLIWASKEKNYQCCFWISLKKHLLKTLLNHYQTITKWLSKCY